jgi:hypothetical protein
MSQSVVRCRAAQPVPLSSQDIIQHSPSEIGQPLESSVVQISECGVEQPPLFEIGQQPGNRPIDFAAI